GARSASIRRSLHRRPSHPPHAAKNPRPRTSSARARAFHPPGSSESRGRRGLPWSVEAGSVPPPVSPDQRFVVDAPERLPLPPPGRQKRLEQDVSHRPPKDGGGLHLGHGLIEGLGEAVDAEPQTLF